MDSEKREEQVITMMVIAEKPKRKRKKITRVRSRRWTMERSVVKR